MARAGSSIRSTPEAFRTATTTASAISPITARLEYVASLGVDAIWISPFFTSPMRDFGYDVADYRTVDLLFGTNEDFDALLARAHGLGLKVIVDLVLSHTSDEHPWFRESRLSRDNPKADWYVWADPKPDGTAPNNWLSVFGGTAWTWDTRRRQYYLQNFLPSQPDLNVQNPRVQDALLEEARFGSIGVDGFRLDAANFYMHDPHLRDNPPRPTGEPFVGEANINNPYFWQRHLYDKSRPENLGFLRRIRDLLDRYPDRMAVAEIGGDDNHIAITAAYVASGLLHTAYNFGFLGRTTRRPTSPASSGNSTTPHPRAGPPGHFRTMTWLGSCPAGAKGENPDPDLARPLMTLLVTLRGTIFVYQGEELGLPEADVPFERLQDLWPHVLAGIQGAGRVPDADAMERRRAHAGFSRAEPWLPVPAIHGELSVSRQDGDPESMLNFTRRLLGWRRSHPALLRGTPGSAISTTLSSCSAGRERRGAALRL